MKQTKRYIRKNPDLLFKRQFESVFGNDLAAASEAFHTSEKTIKRWLTQGCNNEPARILLNIMHRGYLPDEGQWRYWRASRQGLHSPDGKLYTPTELNKWNVQISEYMFNKWFIQDLRDMGLYESLLEQRNEYHNQPVATLSDNRPCRA